MSFLLPIWTISGYILPFVFVLSLLILFHELGHFLTRRELSFGHRDFDRRFSSQRARDSLSGCGERCCLQLRRGSGSAPR